MWPGGCVAEDEPTPPVVGVRCLAMNEKATNEAAARCQCSRRTKEDRRVLVVVISSRRKCQSQVFHQVWVQFPGLESLCRGAAKAWKKLRRAQFFGIAVWDTV